MKTTGLILGLVTVVLVTMSCNKPLPTQYEGSDGLSINISNNVGTVLMIMVPDCPLCQANTQSFNQLSEKFKGRDVSFYGVLPGRSYTKKEMQHFIDSFDYRPAILLDPDVQLVQYTQATVTPEFVLLDSNLAVVYSGKIDDWATDLAQKKRQPTAFYLNDAIEGYLAGKLIPVARTTPVGCIIEGD